MGLAIVLWPAGEADRVEGAGVGEVEEDRQGEAEVVVQLQHPLLLRQRRNGTPGCQTGSRGRTLSWIKRSGKRGLLKSSACFVAIRTM